MLFLIIKDMKSWDFSFNHINFHTKLYINIVLNYVMKDILKNVSKMALNEFLHYIQCI